MGMYLLEEGIVSMFNEKGLQDFQEALQEGEYEVQWSITCERN
jgi:hypothetical protein